MVIKSGVGMPRKKNLEIIKTLMVQEKILSERDIIRKSGLSRSIVFKCMGYLQQAGYVAKKMQGAKICWKWLDGC